MKINSEDVELLSLLIPQKGIEHCVKYIGQDHQKLYLSLTAMMDSSVDSLFDISKEQPSESFIWECEIIDQRRDCGKKEELKQGFRNICLVVRAEACSSPKWGDLRVKPSETAGGIKKEKKSKEIKAEVSGGPGSYIFLIIISHFLLLI